MIRTSVPCIDVASEHGTLSRHLFRGEDSPAAFVMILVGSIPNSTRRISRKWIVFLPVPYYIPHVLGYRYDN